jgi:pimeloyl-ACP methyl ester carboxylesterase
MHRRDFMAMVVGALATGVIGGCATGIGDGASVSVASDAGTPDGGRLDAAAWRAARRLADTALGRIAYVERGSGEAALFLHGFPLNGFQWRGQLERLAPYRRCIAPDLLGLGYTEVPAGQSVAPDAQVAMLVGLLDKLGVATVDLIANDSGGAIAQLFLVRHPQRVRTMLLTTCDTEIDCPPPALVPVIELAREGRFVREWLVPWLADKTLARSPEGLGGMTFTYPSQPTDEAIEYYLDPLVSNAARTHAYALALEKNSLAGIEPLLKRSTAPTRIVWGTGDTIFSPESADYLHRTLGNSRGVRKVEGAKLFFPEEFPDLIAEEARRLWGVA